MRIGIVTETYPPEVNGVAMTLQRLVHGMRQRGHEVQLIRPRQGRGDRGDIENPSGVKSYTVKGLPLPGYSGLRMGLPSGRMLGELWRRERPGVLYVATEGPLGWSAIRRAGIEGIPVISGFHSNFHQYGGYYGVGLLQGQIYRYLRNLHNRCSCTVVPTEEMRQYLLEGRFERVEVMGRGVDTTLFSPAKRSESLRRSWGLEQGDRAVLFVGRLAAEKNIELAIRAYQQMRKAEPRLRFVLVGDGPMHKPLQQRHPGLIFCGVKTGEELARHYASCDYFLFPSETETYGNVTAEAMASGLAVLAFDYAAAAQLIEHGENGLLADFGDHREFIQRAVELLQHRNSAALRRQACNTAHRHDWSRIIDRFETLITRCGEGSYECDTYTTVA